MKAQKRSGKRSGQQPTGRRPGLSQEETRYPIPAASAQAWQAVKLQNHIRLNPGLIFDRFVQDWGWREQRFQDKEAKKKAWQEIVGIAQRADANLLAAWNERWQAIVGASNAQSFSLKTDWRFIAGLGRKGPLEAGFTFNRYGFPILPGSSVKGVARAWAFVQIAEKLGFSDLKRLDEILSADSDKGSEGCKQYETWRAQQSEEIQNMAEDFRAIFGTTATAGQAVFFDAIPASKPEMQLDIMNPHYPQYYSGHEFPTDWQSPVPVYFLTVAPNTEFRFAIGWRGVLDGEGRRLRDLAKEWLFGGLTELGTGAKTSAGYGYFTGPRNGDSCESTQITEATPLSGKMVPPLPAEQHQQGVDEFVRQLNSMAPKDVAGQIARYVERWRQTDIPDKYRLQMAQAILDKVEATGRTKKSRDKAWFQELQAFVAKQGTEKG